MKFEQAFYTRGNNLMRETGKGLGLVSYSNVKRDFLEGCMRIGSNFGKEWSDKTAQFVLYADTFRTFVGVGVSPDLSGEGGDVNKICHIFVPCEEERKAVICNPDRYYLDYPFQRECKKEEQLDQIELSPVLCEKDYLRILEKYHMDQKWLAYFLYKIYPLMFTEKNFVWILVDSQEWKEEEYPVIAREITWLASCLAPGVGEEGIDYRKRLTYSVNAEDNTAIVHIAYSDNRKIEDKHEKICLGKEPDVEIPELYLRLAEKAVESLLSYRNFVFSIMYSQIENIRSEKLRENFFKWKLREGEKIPKRELPCPMDVLIDKAKRDSSFEGAILKYIPQAEDLEAEELRRLLKEIVIRKLLDCTEQEKSLELTKLAEILIFRVYEKSMRLYQKTIAELPKTVKASLVKYLFLQEDSCIRRHFERIETFEEFWNAIKLYSCINESNKYKAYIMNLDFAKEIPELIRNSVLSCVGNPAQNDCSILGIQQYVWGLCEKDIPSRIFCSWAFENQDFNIWKETKPGDVEKYEKVKSVIQNKPYLQKIEEVPLKDEKAELNRVCYCIWKQIVEQKVCELQLLDKFELSKVREDMQNFLESLEKIIIKRADDKDYMVYLIIEVRLDVVWSGTVERTPDKRHVIYDRLKKEEPHFYAGLVKIKCDEEGIEIKEKFEEITKVNINYGKGNKNQVNRMEKDMNKGGENESGNWGIVNNFQNKENEAIKRMDEMEARLARVEKQMDEMAKLLATMENRLIMIEELVRKIIQCLKYQGIDENSEPSRPSRFPDYQEMSDGAPAVETAVHTINRDWFKL
ncbi:hypothetical protein IMSAGC020_02425 [Lachnospiraceae bacterium]|nr:hypothetical protein IMSAGC020_02425 [Lachnospiraceae bacterium]